MHSIDLENVEHHSPGAGASTVELDVFRQPQENAFAVDYYEILRVGPQADDETIERVYRTLADRFHPDNPSTGDQETFLCLIEAYETLSNQSRRAKYNALRRDTRSSTQFWLRGREFFEGVRGGQNRRLAVLCLLYRQRITNHESPGLTFLDLEQLTGCTRDEVTSALWYLCEKQWAKIGEYTAYSITAEGFDFVESKIQERLEFRDLATTSYYRGATERENQDDWLPFDIETAITTEGDVFIADHYEILGIGPQADEEAIEHVYRTLTERFHPDNPETGDPKALAQVREAYETLSDSAKRAEYDALRQRTKYSERFRLRGREFFDGMRGEQLRRLVVLCLLYRQAANELPGLTVLDLEQLTGCTREELGSALWYLREKKWVKYGEFTEYSITAAGFDIVEKKLEDRAAASREIVEVAEGMTQVTSIQDAAETAERDVTDFWESLALEETHGAVIVRERLPGPMEQVVRHARAEVQAKEPAPRLTPVQPKKRVIFSMGGKGGVGKTSVMTGLAEWFEENRIPVTLLDLDTENKVKGSLTHFFGGRVPKINIHTPAGLDAFIDILAEDAPAIVADMGAGAGQITHDWFHKMYPDVSEAGVVFTAIGVVTSDPASVESVLNWAAALEDRVAYIIVENSLSEQADFTYWRENGPAEEFRKRLQPAILRMDNRLADLENAARNHGVTLGRVAGRTTHAPELQKASLVMRAQSYRRRIFAEFDRVKELLLP